MYWQERLKERQVFFNFSFMEAHFDYKPREGNPGWPKEVARRALYLDYHKWARVKGVTEEDEQTFFSVMAPFLYPHGKTKKNIKNHRVNEQKLCRGLYVTVRVSRYFVVLEDIEEHIEAFAKRTSVLLA